MVNKRKNYKPRRYIPPHIRKWRSTKRRQDSIKGKNFWLQKERDEAANERRSIGALANITFGENVFGPHWATQIQSREGIQALRGMIPHLTTLSSKNFNTKVADYQDKMRTIIEFEDHVIN